MPRRVVFTEEEKEEDIKDVLTMLRENPNCTEISRVLGRSVNYICDIRDYLDQEGILTKEELEEIALEKIDEKNKEFDKKVLYLIKSKKSKHQIQVALHAGNRKVDKSIARLSQVLDLNKYQTEEEAKEEERRKKIEDFVNNGTGPKYIAQIAKVTDIPPKTTERLVYKLISEGKIKKESIINKSDEANEKIRKRNEEICNLNDNNVPIEFIAEKYQLTVPSVNRIIREKNLTEDKMTREEIKKRNEEIYTLNDNNVSITEIAKKYGLLADSVRRIIRKRGEQTQQKYTEENVEIKEPDSSLTILEKSILEYLKKGIFYSYICKKENLEQKDLMKIIASLKKQNYINQDIINKAREERKKYYLDTIEYLLKKGFNAPVIYQKINREWEELSLKTIYKFINHLIDIGRITKEEIEENNSLALIDSKVFSLVKKGYTVKEIFETDKATFKTEWQVTASRKRVIESENITREQLEKWRKKREQQKKEEAYSKDEKIIWYYVKNEGFDDKDIAVLIDASRKYVKERRVACQQKHNISDEKYLLIKAQGVLKRMQRIEKEENKKKKLLEKFYQAKKEYQKEYEKLFPSKEIKHNYFDLFVKFNEMDILDFSKEDVNILGFIVLYEEEFQNDENIKYVIKQYLRIGEIQEAMIFLNNYINYYDNIKNNDFTFKMLNLIKRYQFTLKSSSK